MSETTAKTGGVTVTVPTPTREHDSEPAPAGAFARKAQQAAAAMTAHLPEKGPGDETSRRVAQADILRSIGETGFRFVRSDETIYAVPVDGGPIARPIRSKAGGARTGSLRQALIAEYVRSTGRTPSQGCLADAIAALEAMAMDSPDQKVHLRVAPDPEDPSTTWLDLGRSDGMSVCIEPGSWSVVPPSAEVGPLWRRTRLIREIPVPENPPGGWQHGVELLSSILPTSCRMAIAWLLAALRPALPRPIAAILAEQGTGKSTLARMLLRLLEGQDAHLRSVPKTEDDLAVTAAAGWCLPLDNLSGIPGYLSDILSRLVTGEANLKRELYSDDDIIMLVLQRPVLLTGIDLGALKGDLAERFLPIELDPISPKQRRTERDLWARYNTHHPQILGGILDLASQVWAKLPQATTHLTELPRMADFAEMLWALDAVTGWDTLPTYLRSQQDLIDDVIDGDAFATAVLRWTQSLKEPWKGPASTLLTQLPVPPGADDWPRSAAALSGRLQRAAPALRHRGVDIRRTRTYAGRSLEITTTRTP